MNLLRASSVACATLLILAGCVTPSDTEPLTSTTFSERENRLRAIANWEMRGRIAVDTGADAWQGRFTWWQDGDVLRLLIRGPLNSRPVEISGNGAELTVRTRRETRTLVDPESELSELLGWWLPITSLPSWLLGLPDERYPAAALVLEDAAVRTLHQRAWQLEYGAYEQQSAASIPGSIRLSNTPLELVVTVDNWGPQPDSP